MPRHREPPQHVIGRAFRVADARALGLTDGELRHRSVQRPFRGIRAVDVRLDTVFHRCRAYLPALASTAVFSHETAADAYGLPLPRRLQSASTIHVTNAAPTRPRIPGVQGHREKNLWSRRHRGLPLAAPQDVWCQLALSLSVHELVALGDALITGERIPGGRRRPLCTVADIRRAVVRRSPARGTVKLREALAHIRAGVDSPKETELRLLIIEAGFAEPEVGPCASWSDGTPVEVDGFAVHPDLGYPKLRIAFEYEGDHHRTDRVQWQRDIARVRALEAAGWIVIRVTASDINDPRHVFHSLRAALARRR